MNSSTKMIANPRTIDRQIPAQRKHDPSTHVARLIIDSFEQEAPLEPQDFSPAANRRSGLRRWMPALIFGVMLVAAGAICIGIWFYLPVSGTIGADVLYSDLPLTLDRAAFAASQESRLSDGEIRLAAIKTFGAAHRDAEPGFLASHHPEMLPCEWRWDSSHATLSISCKSDQLALDGARLAALLNSFERAGGEQASPVDALTLQLRQTELEQARNDLEYARRRSAELEGELAVLTVVEPTTQSAVEALAIDASVDASVTPSPLETKRRELAEMQVRAQQFGLMVEQKQTELRAAEFKLVKTAPHLSIGPVCVLESRDPRPFAIGGVAAAAGFVMMLAGWLFWRG